MGGRNEQMLGIAVVVVTMAAAIAIAQGEGNIYPDPSFEVMGELGMARSGQRAGHLKVEERQHWVCIGGRISVEPFATYRASAYVKAEVGSGHPFALYCYAWNSFDWAFTRRVLLTNIPEWKRVEVTFVSPHDYLVLHPLGFIDAEHCEAWVDDLVVEKIKGPEETMRPLLAKEHLSREEIQLLARYFVSRNEPEKARALMDQADEYTKADIACLLAKHFADPRQRRPFIVDMVRFGGLTYSNGLTRFAEITAGLTLREQLDICGEALKLAPRSLSAARGYRRVAEDYLSLLARGPFTCADWEERINFIGQSARRILNQLPADAPSRKEVEALTERMAAARGDLEQRRASLGRCVILIGGKKVTPQSHAIVIPEEPTPQERHAAKDLQAHLELLTGQEIPLLTDQTVGSRIPIIVGRSKLLSELGVDLDLPSLGLEGILIKTVGPALILAGNKRGVLYACYTFLEDYLGCRWFTPDCTVLPKEGTFDLPSLNRRYIPPLEYRATDYPNSRDADWAVRNKINGTQTQLDEERGGKIAYSHFVHTFNALIPPEQYFDQHPEYFSEVKGQRIREHTQLCLTNPTVLELGLRRVRQWIEEAPQATIFSVSQNDWWNYCQCPKCTALAEREGSQSGPILHFVNAIADAIRDEYPDKAISTLAYQYSRKPPRHVRPRPNVIVRLCSIECCFAHPLESDPFNEPFREDIQGWAQICQRLYIWDYVINYAHSIMPFPNLYVLKPNINFFIRNGVKGIYEEANYFSKGGEFAELRTWIMAKTLWDPTYDTDRAIDEFLAGYYEEAAPFIREYINLIHQRVRDNPDLHLRIGSPPSAGHLPPEVIRRSVELFDRAEGAVRHKPQVLHRVQVARLPIMYTQIALAKPAYRERGDELVPTPESDVSALVERFEQIARAEGVTRVREGRGGGLDEWLSTVRNRGRSFRIERLRNPSLEVSLLPGLGGRIWRMRYLPSGRDLIKLFGTKEALDPTNGGYEEYSQAEYRSPGWNEPYTVREQSERVLTLVANLGNGLRLTRRLELDPHEPRIRIVSTLSNPGTTPQPACLRIHPAFEVTTTQKAAVWLKGATGKWHRRSLASQKEPLAERELWFRGAEKPAGEWAVVDEVADLAVVNRFRPAQVDLCYLNWSGKERRVNLELWSPRRQLRPGESLEIDHTLQVVQPAAMQQD